MPKLPKIVEDRHPEWALHRIRWRFLLDSYEGGEAYRTAIYGYDAQRLPVRNLFRHKREYPEPGSPGAFGYSDTGNPAYTVGGDPVYASTDDDYSLRLARTPVPSFVSEVVQTHLSGIYAEEVKRESPSRAITEWWADVDGLGTTIDDWAADVLAPLLMVFGCLDIIADHPPAPDGAIIETMADQRVHRLDRCVISVILPENMVNWTMSPDGRRYAECVVCELQGDGQKWLRYWNDTEWVLYDQDNAVVKSGTHPFGRPPIVRVFDRRRPRCENVGLPRYEGIAEEQREYYNRDSELLLSDTTQAHPLLQGPEDFVQASGSLSIGPNWLLPKKKNTQGGTATYEGFDVIDFPKGGADSIRQNLTMIRDRVDRAALLTKPAGAAGADGNTVSQSGVSKRLDSSAGNNLLSKIAARLQAAERKVLEIVALVLGNGTVDQAAIDQTTLNYPKSFDLMSTDEYTKAYVEYQSLLANAGPCPETEGTLMARLVRMMLPGLDDDEYAEIDAELEGYLESKAADHAAMHEAGMAAAMAGGLPAPNALATDAGETAIEAEPSATTTTTAA